jgi:hypothetical protein
VIAHIAEWERFGIMAAGDILTGMDHPRTITDVRGFVENDGKLISPMSMNSMIIKHKSMPPGLGRSYKKRRLIML